MNTRFLPVVAALSLTVLSGCSQTSPARISSGGVRGGSSGTGTQSTGMTSVAPISAAQASAGASIERSVNSPVTASGETYPIASLVDGDTIKVSVGGKKQIVRVLGVDTPETKKPHTPVECYGEEASAHMKSLVDGKSVQLVTDPTQGATDKYGRWLRYVFVDGKDVGLSQIAGGFAREYTYDKAYRAQSAYRQAQSAAQQEGLGTWGAACNGFHLSDGKVVKSTNPQTTKPYLSPKTTENQQSSATSSDDSSQASAPATAPSPQVSGGGLTASAPNCQIKGNIAGGRKVAHVPGDVGYARTKITPNTGERWFCSVADAQAAGWTMAK